MTGQFPYLEHMLHLNINHSRVKKDFAELEINDELSVLKF